MKRFIVAFTLLAVKGFYVENVMKRSLSREGGQNAIFPRILVLAQNRQSALAWKKVARYGPASFPKS